MQTLKTRLPDSELQPIKVKPGSRAYNESQAFFQLLTFSDLHRILDFPIIDQLKNTKKYETEGNVWFYALPIGNLIPITENREQLFIIDYEAESSKRFKPVSNQEDWLKYGFTERMRFFNGRYPLQVGIYDGDRGNIFKEGSDAFMEIHASLPPTTKAPVTLYMEKIKSISPPLTRSPSLAGRLEKEMPSMKAVITPSQCLLLEEILSNLKR